MFSKTEKCDMQSKADAIPYLCNFRHEKMKMTFQLLETDKFKVQCGRDAQSGEKVMLRLLWIIL